MIQQGSGQLPRYDPPLAHRFFLQKNEKNLILVGWGTKTLLPQLQSQPISNGILGLEPILTIQSIQSFPWEPPKFLLLWFCLQDLIGPDLDDRTISLGWFFLRNSWWNFLGGWWNFLGGWWNFEGDLSLSFQIKALGGFQKKSNVIWKWEARKPV